MDHIIEFPEIFFGQPKGINQAVRKVVQAAWESVSWDGISNIQARAVGRRDDILVSKFSAQSHKKSKGDAWHFYAVSHAMDDLLINHLGSKASERISAIERYHALYLSGSKYLWFALGCLDVLHAARIVAPRMDHDVDLFVRPFIENMVKQLPELCKVRFAGDDSGLGWAIIYVKGLQVLGYDVPTSPRVWHASYGEDLMQALIENKIVRASHGHISLMPI